MKIISKMGNLDNHRKFIKIQRLIEEDLLNEGFLRIDTPLLSPVLIPESYLEIFETENLWDEKKDKMYLIPSPELFLKRLISKGIGNCFSLGKSFRNNEPIEVKHSYEFTMLEFYRVNADYFDVAEDVMKMLRFIADGLCGKHEIEYQGKLINLDKYEKITVAEAFNKHAGITNIFDHEEFFKQAREKGYRVEGLDYTEVWSQIYGVEVEPNLGKNGMPTFIYEYPPELAAIVKINEKGIAERFEFYIEGIELGNCGNEGVIIEEYKERFEKDIEIRQKLGLIDYEADFEFIEVLKKMPRCSGIAIGVDRLAMVFLNVKSIEDLKVISIK